MNDHQRKRARKKGLTAGYRDGGPIKKGYADGGLVLKRADRLDLEEYNSPMPFMTLKKKAMDAREEETTARQKDNERSSVRKPRKPAVGGVRG